MCLLELPMKLPAWRVRCFILELYPPCLREIGKSIYFVENQQPCAIQSTRLYPAFPKCWSMSGFWESADWLNGWGHGVMVADFCFKVSS